MPKFFIWRLCLAGMPRTPLMSPVHFSGNHFKLAEDINRTNLHRFLQNFNSTFEISFSRKVLKIFLMLHSCFLISNLISFFIVKIIWSKCYELRNWKSYIFYSEQKLTEITSSATDPLGKCWIAAILVIIHMKKFIFVL